jgi:hypothetical protein
VLQSDIQKSGVAPTDDSFTLITSGKDDTDQDGPALVGDPDLGFKGLRNFGNSFVSHVNLKARYPPPLSHPIPFRASPTQCSNTCSVRCCALCFLSDPSPDDFAQVRRDIAVKNVILVDSPGMIDCPAANKSNRGKHRVCSFPLCEDLRVQALLPHRQLSHPTVSKTIFSPLSSPSPPTPPSSSLIHSFSLRAMTPCTPRRNIRRCACLTLWVITTTGPRNCRL